MIIRRVDGPLVCSLQLVVLGLVVAVVVSQFPSHYCLLHEPLHTITQLLLVTLYLQHTTLS